jgi:otoferlin
MYNSNILSKLTDKMEIGLTETSHLIEQEDTKAEVRLRGTLEDLAGDCNNFLQIMKATQTGPGTGKTKLDKERVKLITREIETIGNMARNLRALVTRSSLKERYKTAQTYHQKLRFIIDDVSEYFS